MNNALETTPPAICDLPLIEPRHPAGKTPPTPATPVRPGLGLRKLLARGMVRRTPHFEQPKAAFPRYLQWF